MEKIKIFTDSTADLAEEIIKKYNIEVLPLLVTINNKTYKDMEEIKFEELMSKINEYGVLPTTTQINPQIFQEAYEKYLKEGYKIISIHLASKLSGTYQSACIAKNTLESDDIYIIDSKTVTAGLGILVKKACNLKEEGKTAEEIFDKINILKDKIKTLLLFTNLDNLIKGGRLSKTAGAIVNLLGIKIVIEIKDGELKVIDKIRGTKKAVKTLISALENSNQNGENEIAVLQAGENDGIEILEEALKEKNYRYSRNEVGCVVGTHSGEGACGIIFIEN